VVVDTRIIVLQPLHEGISGVEVLKYMELLVVTLLHVPGMIQLRNSIVGSIIHLLGHYIVEEIKLQPFFYRIYNPKVFSVVSVKEQCDLIILNSQHHHELILGVVLITRAIHRESVL
jgi:hypothetical protein